MYEPPICDCGEPLCYWEEVVHTELRSITKAGTFSKRKNTLNSETGAWPRLLCRGCMREYEYFEDDEGRICRGNVWDGGKVEA